MIEKALTIQNSKKLTHMSKKITIILLTLVVLIALLLTFIPLVYAPYFIKYMDNDQLKYLENFSDKQEIVLSKFDLFNPKYTLIYNTPEPTPEGQRIILIYQLHRDKLLLWNIDKQNSVTGGTTKYSFEETVKLAKKQDLSQNNPDSGDIEFEGQQDQDDNSDLASPSGTKYAGRKVEQFKLLKKNMIYSEIEKAIDPGDRVMVHGAVKKYFLDFIVQDKGVSFVRLEFDRNINIYSDASLLGAQIVYKDRKVEDLALAE